MYSSQMLIIQDKGDAKGADVDEVLSLLCSYHQQEIK